MAQMGHERKQWELLLEAACLCCWKDDVPFRKVQKARGGGGNGEEAEIMGEGRPSFNHFKELQRLN